jgi:DNA (cytosine-5)-methyltransferase 1
MIGIDVFAGAGGMSLGASTAGIQVAYAVEADVHAASTYRRNHPGTRTEQKDIRRLSRKDVASFRKRKSHLVVFGGPPCQGFSYSNQKTRGASNPENWLFLDFLRLVKYLNPEWVVFENVKGITNTEGGAFLDEVKERLCKQKYAIAGAVLNAGDFGVPQDRDRFFVIGRYCGPEPVFPVAGGKVPVTVKEAIWDLPDLRNGDSFDWLPYKSSPTSEYARLMRGRSQKSPNHHVTRNSPLVLRRYAYVPQGGNWEDIPPGLMKNYRDRTRCHTGIYHRLDHARLSKVIGNYRKNMLIHPTQDRGLSVREAARIQSFPDWYEFMGSIGFQQQQVGNAVPPLLATSVFRSVLEQDGDIQ